MGLATICTALSCPPPSKIAARRAKLIATARTLFAENGFHNTGIAQIAKHSGVLVGQIYRDFANKEDIVAAIVERDMEEFFADAPPLDAAAVRDVPAIRAWIRHYIAVDKSEKDYSLIADILAESSRNERIASIVRSIQDRHSQSIADMLAFLEPDPAKKAQRELVQDIILTVSVGVFYRRLEDRRPSSPTFMAAISAILDREIDALIGD